MRKVYRILLVALILIVALIVAIDYIEFHGAILLGKVADGAMVEALDSFMRLFEGPDRFTNLMFFAIIAVGMMVGLMAITYKFIKG